MFVKNLYTIRTKQEPLQQPRWSADGSKGIAKVLEIRVDKYLEEKGKEEGQRQQKRFRLDKHGPLYTRLAEKSPHVETFLRAAILRLAEHLTRTPNTIPFLAINLIYISTSFLPGLAN